MGKEIQPAGLQPTTLTEAIELSKLMAGSDLMPKDYKDKPNNVLIAIQFGSELGLAPMAAIQNIAVINGRPCVFGDAIPALAKANPQFEYMNETFDESTMTATCKIKRKGEPEQIVTFSKSDAEKAKLWAKVGPWTQYPARMLKMRARAFAIRDVFPDSLKGLRVAEEVRDYQEEIDITPEVEKVEAPKATTTSKVANKLANKTKPKQQPVKNLVTKDDIFNKMEKAKSIKELQLIGEQAAGLENEQDKEDCRDIYNLRMTEFKEAKEDEQS